MKSYHSALWLRLICLGGMLPMCAGCVVVRTIYMRNTSASTVKVLLVKKREWHSFLGVRRNHLRYASRLLPRKHASIAKLNDSLPVIATDTSFSFRLPAHSTVLIGGGQVSPFTEFKTLRLQRADSSVQILDSTRLARSFHLKPFNGGSFWYDIPATASKQ